MLAGLRDVAWSVAMVVAGFLAVALADCVWIILSFSDARVFFFGDPTVIFGGDLYVGYSTIAELVVGLAVVIWLIGYAVRRASKSIAAGR
jgi:hypothetical protein